MEKTEERNNLDFLPDKEFHIIFGRVSKTVNLKGANTPEKIDKKLKHKIKAFNFAKKVSKDLGIKKTTLKRFEVAKKNTQTLINSNFAITTISHARRHPDELPALTIVHGREKATEIKLARSRKLKRMLRIRRLKRRN